MKGAFRQALLSGLAFLHAHTYALAAEHGLDPETAHELAVEGAHGAGMEDHGGGVGLPQFDPSSFPSQMFWLAVTFAILYLFFSNKTAADIIYEKELTAMLGKNAQYILSREQKAGYESGIINADFLRSHVTDFSKHFYVCGPDKMTADINAALEQLGASPDLVVFEK